MAPAPCGHCGGTAISYGRHLLNMSPRSLCASCGRPVRKRAFRTILVVAALLGGVVGYYVFSVGEGARWTVALITLAGVLLLDYLTWRWLPWDPDPEAMVYDEEAGHGTAVPAGDEGEPGEPAPGSGGAAESAEST